MEIGSESKQDLVNLNWIAKSGSKARPSSHDVLHFYLCLLVTHLKQKV